MNPLSVLAFTAAIAAQAPEEPTPIVGSSARGDGTVVVIDDRAVKGQAPAPYIQKAVQELSQRKGVTPVLMSEARKQLPPRADRLLSACGDDLGCLAKVGGQMGGDEVVALRVTTREDATFVAMTRINALRPQINDETATLTNAGPAAVAAVTDAVAELYGDRER